MRTERELLVVFLDLSNFAKDAERTPDVEVAERLDEWYRHVHAAVTGSGGTVVKFIGDGALAVWEPGHADAALAALLDLRALAQAWLHRLGWVSRVVIRAHTGPVIAGPFGPPEIARFDVIGGTVNVAARVATRACAITPQVFRLLSADARRRWKKHTPPVTYLPVGDGHP